LKADDVVLDMIAAVVSHSGFARFAPPDSRCCRWDSACVSSAGGGTRILRWTLLCNGPAHWPNSRS
jgi:hypothetical protein